MEKELLETFEAAEKAAEAAATGDGRAADVDRCVDALKQMRKMPVTTKDLVATQVGKRIRSLTKHSKPKIQAVASDLFQFWRNMVIEETSSKDSKKTNSTSEDRKVPKPESKPEKSDITMPENTINSGPSESKSDITMAENTINSTPSESKSESIKVELSSSADKHFVSEKLSIAQTVKIEKTMVERTIKVEERKILVAKKPMIPTGPPKLTSMVKCNDPIRDKLRELLFDSFSKVSPEASEDDRDEVRNILDEINACDPIRVAVTVESAMFEKLGRSNGTHKVKYRSIMFNLKDAKNPDLRRRVLLGHIMPEKLINMTAEEMASDERKLSNKQIQEKALFECERAAAPKASTDQFKCGRCGQRKCTYYQLQTRSADEPMTTFVTCVNCNNHWKFC